MAYVAPSSQTTGTLITADIWNQDVVDNPTAIYAGGIAISSQAALDFIYAGSATQLARLAKVNAQAPRINSAGNAWEFASPTSATNAVVWPVGSVFIATVSTNPDTLLGLGGTTWTAFGAGRTLVSLDSAQSEFDTAEETGGSKTHTLTSSEMPSHSHTQDAHGHTQNSHNHTQDAHGHTVTASGSHSHSIDLAETFGTSNTAAQGGATASQNTNITSLSGGITPTAATATNQATAATNQSTVATNQNTGSGGAHANVQPYIVVYMWKRTA